MQSAKLFPMKKAGHSHSNEIIIFADGASSGNPGQGGWGTVIVNAMSHVQELGGAKADVTNNQMELTAAGHAMRYLEKTPGPVKIHTDSKYVIEGITKFIKNWVKNDWKTKTGSPVANQIYWKRLNEILEARKQEFGEEGYVNWVHVPGHAGVLGNERADEIAQGFAQGKKPTLYSGDFKNYKVNVLEGIDDIESLTSEKPYYLSLVNGKLERHETWKQCEARVKGAPSPKYKKCNSKLQEAQILKEWGVK